MANIDTASRVATSPAPLAESAVIAAPGGLRGVFSSLQNRNFRVFWIGMLFSFIGLQMGQVAQQWLVYELTGSSTYLGVVGAATGLPMLGFSLLGGVVADRVVKRNLLIITQGSIGLLAFLIAILLVMDLLRPWHVLAVAFLSGIIFSFNAPGRQSMIPELVPPGQLMNAIALNSAGMNFTRIIAPTIAGILIGVIGLAGTYYVYASQYVIAVALLFLLPASMSSRSKMGTMQEDAVEGMRYVIDNKVVLGLLILGAVPIIFALPYQTLLPVFVKDVLRAGPETLGLMLGAVGFGAIAGSFGVAFLGNSFRHKGLLMLGAALAFGLAVVLFSQSRSIPVSLATLVLLGAGSMTFMAVNQTIIQMMVPEEVRGRVMGLYIMSWGLMPLGSLPAGVLADVIGAPAIVAIGGGITVVVALGALLFAPALRRLE